MNIYLILRRRDSSIEQNALSEPRIKRLKFVIESMIDNFGFCYYKTYKKSYTIDVYVYLSLIDTHNGIILRFSTDKNFVSEHESRVFIMLTEFIENNVLFKRMFNLMLHILSN